MTAYKALVTKMQEIADLRGAVALMAWDQETYMPSGSAGMRARQTATVQGIAHQKFVEDVPALLAAAEALGPKELTPHQQRNLRKIRRDLDKQVKIPKEHVMACSQVSSQAMHAWAQARKDNSWKGFEPFLEQLADLKRKEAEMLGYEENPYDALLDNFEPDMTARRLEEVFAEVKETLGPLLSDIKGANQVGEEVFNIELDPTEQLKFGELVVKEMGYDLSTGRQDVSAHPFTMGISARDVRITTATDPGDLRVMLYSSVHEGGHAIYEQGLSTDEYGMPGGEACSLSIHESQSRLWENNVARSLDFWNHFTPVLQKTFPGKFDQATPEAIFKAVNKVEPGLIRIHTDELTYHFHIILRFELENDLINGRIEVKDLPEAWNAKVKSYLGLDVPSDQKGVLQDIHWSFGSFGYFPTYSLGSLYAAQLMAAAGRDYPDLQFQFAQGNMQPVKQWMNEKIHDKGRLYTAEKLCEMATGEGLNVKYFGDYARAKFNHIYGLS